MENIIRINRWALFIVYFWFGFLKILGFSPAHDLVTALADITVKPFMPITYFVQLLGIFECLIGVLWLIPKFTKIALGLLLFHLITTFLPCIFLPQDFWQNSFVPSLVGQYIIKNVVLVGSALAIYGQRFRLA